MSLSEPAKKQKLAYASSGIGTTTHLSMERIKTATGVDITHVPYKGAAPAVADVVAGRIDLIFDSVSTSGPLVRSGKLKVLAVMANQRSSFFPDAPTLAEEGADPGLTVYFCIFAPAKTPPAIIARLNEEFAKAIKTPRVQDFYRTYTLRPEGNSAAEFAEFLKSDRAIASKVFTALGIKPGAAPP